MPDGSPLLLGARRRCMLPTRFGDARQAGALPDSVGDQLALGDRRRLSRDVHAGRLRVPRDRLLARQERGHGRREDPHELLDRRAHVLGRRLRLRLRRSARSSATTGSSCATTATRRRRSRSWASPTRRSSRSGSSSSSSAPSRWRSSGARRSSGSSSASTSSTRSSSPAIIYPIASHWVFGGGWLQTNLGMQDFAGSTAVHLIGATGALAVLLHLGPRRGKYGPDGKPRAIPGHNMPLFGLGVLILWLGWFGFNPGSTLERAGRPLHRGPARHAARGRRRRARRASDRLLEDEDDRHRHGRQRRDRRARRHHRALGLRGAVGRADHRRASPA